MTRAEVLAAFGAEGDDLEALLAYGASEFVGRPSVIPLADEPHVAFWRAWAREGERDGVFRALQRHLPQLTFPVAEGMSRSDDYREAVLRGRSTTGMASATGLVLEHPDDLRLLLYETAAGVVPVLLPRGRADYESVVRSLAGRCEPIPLLASMGACTVKGFNDWERIRAYQAAWMAEHPDDDWNAEFGRLQQRREMYQDRFLILSDGNYSDMPSSVVGLSDDAWRQKSVDIRTRHECTHYVTQRIFGSARNNALDELVCDFVGFSSAFGVFRADLFLHGMGLEDFPRFREGGRLRHYCPDLSPSAFSVLCALTRAAAETLERFDRARPRTADALLDEVAVITALCAMTIEDMATEGSENHLLEACAASRVEVRRA